MARRWHPDEGASTCAAEIEAMAQVLEARHGSHAAEVAEFFSLAHGQEGDAPRSWAWNGVAAILRRRSRQRLMRSLDL